MLRVLRSLVGDEDGQDIVEYGLLSLLLSLVTWGTVWLFGGILLDAWGQLADFLIDVFGAI